MYPPPGSAIAVSTTPFTDSRLDQRNWVRGMDSPPMTGSHCGMIFRRERISFLLLCDPKSSIRAIYTSSAHIVPLSSWIYRVPAHRLLEWSYGLRSAKLCALWMVQAFICAIVLRRFCAGRKVGARLYFCADFAHFVTFVGSHSPLIDFPRPIIIAVLAIAPVCAERIKVSNERGIVDSTLSAIDGVDCGGGGLRSRSSGGGRRRWRRRWPWL